jgi:propanol-preferring alcohol dehydrogenase
VGIFGLGPVGLGATMISVFLGATVIGIDINKRRLSMASDLGAKHLVNPTESDTVSSIRELTDGRGLDVALECAGSDATFGYALESMNHFGKIALIGENNLASFNPSNHFLGHELTLTGSRYYHYADYEKVLDLIKNGLRPERMISHRFPLSEAATAFQLFDSGLTAKVILLP